jgi:hypothetical protein
MNMKKHPTLKDKAVAAMNRAVAHAIDGYRKTGEPIPVWKNNQVVMLPSSTLPVAVQEEVATYAIRPVRQKKPSAKK